MTKEEVKKIQRLESHAWDLLLEAEYKYIEGRGAGFIAFCIGCVESFIEKNDLKPKINDTLKGRNKYSIAYDTLTGKIITCVTYSDFVLPFFVFDDEEKAQKVIDNCKDFLLEIFAYFIFAGGKT